MLLLARYVLPVSSDFIENGAILVQDGKIAAVGKAADLRAQYPDEEERDFGLAALMPGFVDCYAQLEQTILRGILNDIPYALWRAFIEQKRSLLDEDVWHDSALLGAYEAVTSGITTVGDLVPNRNSFDAIKQIGLRGVVYRQVGARERKEITGEMERAAADIQAWSDASDGRIRVGIGPESLYTCHPEVLGEVAAFATQTHTPVAIRAAVCKEEYEFIKYGYAPFAVGAQTDGFESIQYNQSTALLPTGYSPVKYALNWEIFDVPECLAIHCVKVDDQDVRQLAERDVRICACPRANAKLGMGVAPIIAMRKAGLTVGLGTDSSAACDSLDPMEEMRFTMLIQRAVGGKDGFINGPSMVRMATLDSARALGIDHLVGSLEPGKLADIVAVDLSNSSQVPTHFPYSAVIHTAERKNIVMTMVEGKVVYDARDGFAPVTNADPREIRRIVENTQRVRSRLRKEGELGTVKY